MIQTLFLDGTERNLEVNRVDISGDGVDERITIHMAIGSIDNELVTSIAGTTTLGFKFDENIVEYTALTEVHHELRQDDSMENAINAITIEAVKA